MSDVLVFLEDRSDKNSSEKGCAGGNNRAVESAESVGRATCERSDTVNTPTIVSGTKPKKMIRAPDNWLARRQPAKVPGMTSKELDSKLRALGLPSQ